MRSTGQLMRKGPPMFRHAFMAAGLAGFLFVGSPSHAGPPDGTHEAAALLSRYPAGSIPVDPTTMTALLVLAEEGVRDDISLLRNLAEHEREEVRQAALSAISRIRDRQRSLQREDFARSISTADAPRPRIEEYRARGYGYAESECAAYMRHVLGDSEIRRPDPKRGDAARLLSQGQPLSAVAALADDDSSQARYLEALAWEDLGHPRFALRQYAVLAAMDDSDAVATLQHFGVDVERLLLGMLSAPPPFLEPTREAQLLDMLVRRGSMSTVKVLAERSRGASATIRATATDALARMLDHKLRPEPLDDKERTLANEALVRASRDRLESIRSIALDAL